MNPNNPLQKSLQETYFQGGKDYQYGGWVPEKPFVSPATPTPTPSITPTIPITPTPTPTLTLTPTATLPIVPTTDLVFHYDFSNSSNVLLRSSGGIDYVETMFDLSPNGFDITQVDTAKQPVYSADSFGNLCATFDGVDDVMSLSGITSITGKTEWSYFIVFEMIDYTIDSQVIAAPFIQPHGLAYGDANDTNFLTTGANVGYNSVSGWTKQPNFLLYYRRDNITSPGDSELNDTTYSQSYTFPFSSTLTRITFCGEGISNSKIKLKEVLLYSDYVSDVVKNNILTYLKNKWDYSIW